MSQALQVSALQAGVTDSSGVVLTGGSATFYESDGVTIKTIWADAEKVATSANPVTLSSSGTAAVFADGIYNVVVKDSTGSVVYNWNSNNFEPNATGTDPYIDASSFGSAKDEEAISLAITSASGEDRTVFLAPGNWTITDDLTIPTNINLRFEMGAYCTISLTKTLTVNGVLQAPLYNIFRGTGTVTIENKNFFIPSIWPIGGTHDNSTLDGIVTVSDEIKPGNLKLSGNTIISTDTDGDINVTPNGTGNIILDAHLNINGPTVTSLTDNNTVLSAYAGKNITIEDITFDGGVVAGIGSLTVDNVNVDGNTIISTDTNGDINVTPNGTGNIILDAHLNINGPAITSLTDNNTVLSAYAGKNITIEGVTFDGGVVAGVTDIYTTAWTSWTPTITASGSMTISSTSINLARYYVLGKTLFFQIDVSFTTGGTASTGVYISLPVNSKYNSVNTSAYILDSGARSLGHVTTGGNVLETFKVDISNWGLSSGQVLRATGFYEID